MSVLNENQLLGASGAGGDYEIEQSLRFDDGSTSYLKRTPSTASNRRTWTFSAWIKRGSLPSNVQTIFMASNPSSAGAMLRFNSDKLVLLGYNGGVSYSLSTNRLFRDPSAWYHIVLSVDTTQGTAANRLKMYVNGVQETSFSSATYPSQNLETYVNTTNPHYLGVTDESTLQLYFDGYMGEVNFIDGQALTPDSFGETGDYGEWKAKSYAGGYGTNGFYLDFKSSGSLGNDAAGSNNWTIHNLAATDQMVDSPTNNFATFNPLDNGGNTLSEGNLVLNVSSGFKLTRSTFFADSGKWYWEVLCTDSGNGWVGVSTAVESLTSRGSETSASVNIATSDGDSRTGAATSSYGSAFSDGDIMMLALDMDNGKFYAGKNGTWFNSGNPATSTNPAKTGLTTALSPSISLYDNEDYNANFGADSSFAEEKTPQGNADSNDIGDFFYPPPTGFLALCTKNLPNVDVIPSENFNAVIYTGNNSTNVITGVGFKSDLSWWKKRNSTADHALIDSVRGVTKHLVANTTTAEVTASSGTELVSFDSDGFTLGATNQTNSINGPSASIVAWNWKAGGAAVSNTNGTITSSVSANAAAGFSIVSWDGASNATGDQLNNGGAYWTIGHGLSQAPELIIVKKRDGGTNNNSGWYIGSDHLVGSTPWTSGTHILFNTTAQANEANNVLWGNAAPSSTLITVGAWNVINHTISGTPFKYIAYAFHSVEGYSKVGSYTGNGDENGPFVHCGFKPAFLLFRRSTETGSWFMFDNERGTTYNVSGTNFDNVRDNKLNAEANAAEDADSSWNIDFLSNGFKLRSPHVYMNGNNLNHIFIAFAENPFKHSNAH